MSNVIVTKALATVGLAVMRGRDWSKHYGDQDIFPGNKGTIISIGGENTKYETPKGWVKVKWEDGGTFNYQVEGSFSDRKVYDLYIYKKAEEVKLPNQIPRKSGYRGRFYEGQTVYVKDDTYTWVRENKMIKDQPYTVWELNQDGGGISVRISGLDYWIADHALMTQEEYWETERAKRLTQKSKKLSVEQARNGLEELARISIPYYGKTEEDEEESIYKPNINKTNGTSNTDPIKVRRPVSTIQGSKRRSRA